jgi:hypothetical protein
MRKVLFFPVLDVTSRSSLLPVGEKIEIFYGAQYDHILPSEKDLYINIEWLRFIYTTKILITNMR